MEPVAGFGPSSQQRSVESKTVKAAVFLRIAQANGKNKLVQVEVL
jgi:hypothetical protein